MEYHAEAMTVSGATVLWTYRSMTSGRTVDCMLIDAGHAYEIRLTYGRELPAAPEVFGTRAEAISHAAELAAELEGQGWVEVLPD
jgi:hypothetical protein